MQRALRCHVRCHDTIDRDDRLLSVIGHFLLPTVRLPFRLPLPLPSPLPVFPSLPAFPVPLLPAPFLRPLPVLRPLPSASPSFSFAFDFAPFPFVFAVRPFGPFRFAALPHTPFTCNRPSCPPPPKRERTQRKEHTEKRPWSTSARPLLLPFPPRSQLFSFAESAAWISLENQRFITARVLDRCGGKKKGARAHP